MTRPGDGAGAGAAHRREMELTDAADEARRIWLMTVLIWRIGWVSAILTPVFMTAAVLLNIGLLAGAVAVTAVTAWLCLSSCLHHIATTDRDRITGETKYLTRIEVDRRRHRDAARELNRYWLERADKL